MIAAKRTFVDLLVHVGFPEREVDPTIASLAREARLVQGNPAGASRSGVDLTRAVVDGRLDDASAVMSAYAPYAAALAHLRERKVTTRRTLVRIIEESGTPEGTAHVVAGATVLLGQAFTVATAIADGSRRPDPVEVAEALAEAFEIHETDGMARCSLIVPAMAAKLSTSPHALSWLIERADGAGCLPDHQMQASAGGPVSGRDRVAVATETGFASEKVPDDRIYLGGRPVFVIVREPARRLSPGR